MNPQDYMRKGVQRSAVYHAAAQPDDYSDIIKLNSNENPYPLPGAVLEDALSALQSGHNFYPEDDALTFRQTVSALYGLQPDQVLVGNGEKVRGRYELEYERFEPCEDWYVLRERLQGYLYPVSTSWTDDGLLLR